MARYQAKHRQPRGLPAAAATSGATDVEEHGPLDEHQERYEPRLASTAADKRTELPASRSATTR